MKIFLANEDDTLALGASLSKAVTNNCLIFLHGQLGAGKTTLVRGSLRESGYSGTVKSPTYTLVEEYDFKGHRLYHFDLYRLSDPEELEWMGIRDYFDADAICFIEWPERGTGLLPTADLDIHLELLNSGRSAIISSLTDRGQNVIDRMK